MSLFHSRFHKILILNFPVDTLYLKKYLWHGQHLQSIRQVQIAEYLFCSLPVEGLHNVYPKSEPALLHTLRYLHWQDCSQLRLKLSVHSEVLMILRINYRIHLPSAGPPFFCPTSSYCFASNPLLPNKEPVL